MIEQTPPAGPRAKRPARTRRIPASVGLDPADLAALDALAARLGRTRSALIREAVRRTWLRAETDLAPASAEAWEDARERVRQARARDRQFAAMCQRPLGDENVGHELLDSLHAGEFRTSDKG